MFGKLNSFFTERAEWKVKRHGRIFQNLEGFTLIELMIVVAVVGILAAIAYPAYQDSVRKTRRADAQRALIESGQRLETYYTENKTYVGFPAANLHDTDFYDVTFPDPPNPNPDATSYVLQAAPTGAQAGNGSLQLDEKGNKWWDKDNDGNFTDDEKYWK